MLLHAGIICPATSRPIHFKDLMRIYTTLEGAAVMAGALFTGIVLLIMAFIA